MNAAITQKRPSKAPFFPPSCTQSERTNMNVTCRTFHSSLCSGSAHYGHCFAWQFRACVNFKMVLMDQKTLREDFDNIYFRKALLMLLLCSRFLDNNAFHIQRFISLHKLADLAWRTDCQSSLITINSPKVSFFPNFQTSLVFKC